MKAIYLTKTQEGTHLSSHVQVETLKVATLPKRFVEVTCLFARPFANNRLMASLPMMTVPSGAIAPSFQRKAAGSQDETSVFIKRGILRGLERNNLYVLA